MGNQFKYSLTKDIKKANRSRIYQLLYTQDYLTKRDFQSQLDLSLPTVTQNLTELIDEGLISKIGRVGNTGGRSAVAYSINAQSKVAIGLDITKNHIVAVIIDLHGNVITHFRIRKVFERTDAYVKQLGDVVNQIISDNQIDRSKILGVGIGLPGLVNKEQNEVVYGKIINIKGSTSETFAKYIDFPVRIINDANAACNIELFSLHDNNANGFYIMLSNNIGGAVFINGESYTGENFRSGEIGHLNIHPGGLQCYCGQRGCVDPYCSASVLTSITDGDLDRFFTLLEQEDPTATTIWSSYIQNLVLAVRNARILFDCPIIIGGYVGARIDKYMDNLRDQLSVVNSFDKNSDYVIPCKYKTEAIAAGAALSYIKDFLASI